MCKIVIIFVHGEQHGEMWIHTKETYVVITKKSVFGMDTDNGATIDRRNTVHLKYQMYIEARYKLIYKEQLVT